MNDFFIKYQKIVHYRPYFKLIFVPLQTEYNKPTKKTSING